MPTRGAAVAAIVAAAVLFGTTGTAQELGPDGTTPMGVGALRIVVGSAALWCFARRRPDVDELRRHLGRFVVAGLGVAVYQPGFFTGTARSGVALGTVVALGSGPVFAGVIEWWRSGRAPPARWAVSTALSVLGGALLVFADGGGATVDAVGIAGSLTAGLGYAVYAVVAKDLIERGVHPTVSLAWPFTIGAVLLTPVLAIEPLGWVAGASGLVMVVHLGVLATGLAYHLYGSGLRAVPTSTAVTLTLAEPVTAAVLAVVVVGESLEPWGWVGAGLVVVGLALVGGVRLRPWRRG